VLPVQPGDGLACLAAMQALQGLAQVAGVVQQHHAICRQAGQVGRRADVPFSIQDE
jgi:hypothetical protein